MADGLQHALIRTFSRYLPACCPPRVAASLKFGPGVLPWVMKRFHLDDADLGIAKSQVVRHGGADLLGPVHFRFAHIGRSAGRHAGNGTAFSSSTFSARQATWVVTMSTSGFLFASMFDSSLEYLEKASWGITLVVVGASIMCGAARRSVIKNAKH